MSFSPTSPVAGADMGALASPTYTLVSDTAPDSRSIQFAVSAVGGTAAGVVVSSVSKPFTITFARPAAFKQVPPVNPVTGVLPRVGNNVWTLLTRKGVIPLSGQAAVLAMVRTEISVPAGADAADVANVLAALSLHVGALSEQADEIATSLITGIL